MGESAKWIEPNPDIAGIGIIVSFVIIGSSIMVLYAFALCRSERDFFVLGTFFWPPEELDAWTDESNSQPSVLNNTIASLTLSQSVTGIAIATAALLNEEITAYHFYLCEEMGWMALIASTIDLTTARREKTTEATTVKKIIRVVVLWALLGVLLRMATLRNDFIGWNEEMYRAEPAWNTENLRVIANIIFLACSILAAVIDALATIPGWGPKILCHIGAVVRFPLPQAQRILDNVDDWFSYDAGSLGVMKFTSSFILGFVGYPIFFALYLATLPVYWWTLHPVTSYLVNLAFFVLGTHDVFQFRRDGRRFMQSSDQDEEDIIGFGQIVALMLIAPPILTNVDLWYKRAVELKKQKGKLH